MTLGRSGHAVWATNGWKLSGRAERIPAAAAAAEDRPLQAAELRAQEVRG